MNFIERIRCLRLSQTVYFGILSLAISPSHATVIPNYSVEIHNIVSSPSSHSNYLNAALAIDRTVDPTADTTTASAIIDRLATAAKRLAGPKADDNQKFAAVRKVIYEAGEWNDNRPFRYDLSDPLGSKMESRLLSTYIKTRLGNCVSMPMLFLIVAERLGLNVRFATAPLHVLVQYAMPNGHIVNIEATSGGFFQHTAWYRKNLPMTDRAIASGIYMRPLSKAEGIALLRTTLVEHLLATHRYQEAMDMADSLIAVNPRDAFMMVKKGSAIAGQMRVDFFDKYPNPQLIPVGLRPRYQMLAAANDKAFKDAEALGWQPSE